MGRMEVDLCMSGARSARLLLSIIIAISCNKGQKRLIMTWHGTLDETHTSHDERCER